MRKFFSILGVVLMLSTGCAGIPVAFTEYRLMDWPVESRRSAVNSSCIELPQLNVVANLLEEQHLRYLQTHENIDAIDAEDILVSLGGECESRFSKLSVPQIKTELFGDIQTIAESDKLRELGGLAFDYEDVATMSGIEISLHMRKADSGPDRRIVAIYRLADKKVIHYNYSGTDNVDKKSRSWPIDAFFAAIIGVGLKAVIP